MKGVATLSELETYYSITDIQNRCDALDAVEDAEEVMRQRQQRKQPK